MSNFVDVHHHLIYGIDDGAKSLEDMQQMILRASEEGVTDIVCTSHVTPAVEPFPMEKYLSHLDEARAFIAEQGIGMHLHPGCEVLYTDAAARLIQEDHYPSLADSSVVLVEFMPDVSMRELVAAATNFGMAGYDVLFAHVERYEVLRNLKYVRALREEMGVYMQMNASTVIGKRGFFTERWFRHMMEEGCIDCVATDSHNLTHRSCKMRQCHEVLTAKYGVELADELCGEFQRRLLGI